MVVPFIPSIVMSVPVPVKAVLVTSSICDLLNSMYGPYVSVKLVEVKINLLPRKNIRHLEPEFRSSSSGIVTPPRVIAVSDVV